MNTNFSAVDRHFSDFLCRKGKIGDVAIRQTFARLSQTLGQQNTCLRIDDVDLIESLLQLECVTHVDLTTHNDPINTPLVFVSVTNHWGFLYTNRFYTYETRIKASLISRNQLLPNPKDKVSALRTYLTPADDPLQVRAATLAVTRQLGIITGGPGTGKTSTVVKILAALLADSPALTVRLAAPTGKAAMRLSESIQSAASHIGAEVPSDVSTIHRLLGMRGDGQSFAYNAQRKLPADLLILDEASMIDLVMFDRLLDALEPSTQLILLGDPYQLPSVDSGSVLADITAQGTLYTKDYEQLLAGDITLDANEIMTGGNPHPLADTHCALKTSFRFQDDSGIGQLARVLRESTTEVELNNDDEVQYVKGFDQPTVIAAMANLYDGYLQACLDPGTSPEQLLDLFESARLLTPLREGEFGVEQLNQTFEDSNRPDTESYYHGKPVMIERNHYALRLFNGDIGICVQRGDKIEVAFRKPSGELEYYLPSRLPQHETCYAMTVHKSQGSEFDKVALVLPETSQENFISRELVYTGVTRCRKHLTVYTAHTLTDTQPDARVTALSLRFRPPTEEVPAESSSEGADSTKGDSTEQQLDLF